jgi:hypothetical protein
MKIFFVVFYWVVCAFSIWLWTGNPKKMSPPLTNIEHAIVSFLIGGFVIPAIFIARLLSRRTDGRKR